MYLVTFFYYTINEMLEDYNNIDEQSLIEGLSRYYYTHGESFNGLYIKPENMERFNMIKDWAIEYYSEGDKSLGYIFCTGLLLDS